MVYYCVSMNAWSRGEIVTATILGVVAIVAGILTIGGAGFIAGQQVDNLIGVTPTPIPFIPVATDGEAVACGIFHAFAAEVADSTQPMPSYDAHAALGAPDNNVVNYDNRGSEPGFATFSFPPDVVMSDEPGPDIYLHLKDFFGPEDESFTLLASQDGVNFISLGSRDPTGPAALQAEILYFDLAGNLPWARYVKILNNRVTANSPWEGPDIDAMEALHAKNCQPTPLPSLSPTPASSPNYPQCSDGQDNEGDTHTDATDPGCHSDGNPNNPTTYQPLDDDENDGGSNVTPTLTPTPGFDPGGVKEID